MRQPDTSPPDLPRLDWDDLRFFLAVAGAGSLSAAARSLRVNTTTVLRRISGLERVLDARLFERERSGYQLTQDGARLLESLAPIDAQFSSLLRDFHAARAKQSVVRLGASAVLVQSVFAPALAQLQKQNPHITLEFVTDTASGANAPRVLDPLRDVDLALRLARPMDGDMLMRKLGDMPYGLYATPKLAKTYEGDLAGKPLIAFGEHDEPLGPVWWLAYAREAELVARASSALVRAGLAQAGLGFAVLPRILGDSTKGLVRLSHHGQEIGGLEIWLLARTDMARLPHVRAVMDFLINAIQTAKPALLGSKRLP